MELGKNNMYLRALTPDNLSFRPKRNKDMRKLALTFSYRDFTDFFRVSYMTLQMTLNRSNP